MKNKILVIILIIVILTIIFINYLNKKIMPKVMAYAIINTEKLGTFIINDAVSKNVLDNLNTTNLFIISKNNNDEVISIDFNTIIVNKILTTATNQIEKNLTYLEKDKLDSIMSLNNIELSKNGIFFLIPSGVAINPNYLANLGPKIPVKIEFSGSVVSNISTNVINYGINNALFEVYLNISVTLKVIMPFISKDIIVKTKVPLIMKMINGKVPEYYLNGYLNSPTKGLNM